MCTCNQESVKEVMRILIAFPHCVLANIGKVITEYQIATSQGSFREMKILTLAEVF